MKHWMVITTLAVGLGAFACNQEPADSGCKKDTDCKGDRVCVEGACVGDDDAKKKSGESDDPKKKKKKKSGESDDAEPPKTAEPEAKAPPEEKPPESDSGNNAAAGGFAKVDKEAAGKRLGPKMKAGSTIVHDVFEGPFGPSPQSLFALTQRKDASFWVYVMGDDDKPWPAGPLADPDSTMGMKISAVSFFDANGDGTTDALVMAVYSSHRGKPIFNENVLLKWTDLGMRRLLNLEPKIKRLESVAAVKKALGVQ